MMLIGKKFRFNNVFLSRKNKVVVHEVAKLDNAFYKGIMEKCEKNIPLTLKEFIIISKCYNVSYTIIIIKKGTYFKRIFDTSDNILSTVNEALNEFLSLDIGKLYFDDMDYEKIHNICIKHKIKIKIR